MKKLIFCIFALALTSCINSHGLKPVEYHFEKGYVVVAKSDYSEFIELVQLKNTDTIIRVKLLKFDSSRYNVGDTLKPIN